VSSFANFDNLLGVRGGSSDYEEYSDVDNSENDDAGKEIAPTKDQDRNQQIMGKSRDRKKESFLIYGIRQVLLLCCHSSFGICKAVAHKLQQNQGASSLPLQLIQAIERSWVRAIYFFFPSSLDHGDPRDDQSLTTATTENNEESSNDMGLYLIQSYLSSNVSSNLTTASSIIRGGSLNDALIAAWNQAKLLLVYIPSKTSINDVDATCVRAITSPDVTQVVQAYKSGSYVIWSAKANSPEAKLAHKRLHVVKTKTLKGRDRSPILLVCCPTMQLQQKTLISCKTLAQHHCNPPPSARAMSLWLKALRKRHAKEVAKMNYILQEQQRLKERQVGYEESMKSDIQREIDERQKKVEDEARKQLEKERMEERKQYRQALLEGLPEEPNEGDGVITVGLRLPDGKSGTRRFPVSDHTGTKMQSIFHWLEGQFDVEKEGIKLMTMTGSKSFTYIHDRDLSIGEALSSKAKLVALRVIPLPKKDTEAVEDSKEEVAFKG
jgi:Skp family chaperone for outer membrane proteins